MYTRPQQPGSPQVAPELQPVVSLIWGVAFAIWTDLGGDPWSFPSFQS